MAFARVQALVRKLLLRLGHVVAFLELALPASHAARLCRAELAICHSCFESRHPVIDWANGRLGERSIDRVENLGCR